jgi:acyl-CoA thioester hydrolase
MYDDVITVQVRHTNVGRIRIDHEYRILRGDELLAEASTTLACVNAQGKPTPMPEGFIPPA